MNGSLEERFSKGGKEVVRQLNPDREYISSEGKGFKLPGRALLIVRNVGHLMTNNAILFNGEEELDSFN